MTGIERLRKEAMRWLALYDIESHGLLKIADQIERETLPRPLFEDGEPVQFGDRFVANTGEVRQVERITCLDNGRFVLMSEYGHRYIVGKEKADGKRAKRPEVDTWERIAADVDSGKGYAGMDAAEVAADVLRRCKALAGVE